MAPVKEEKIEDIVVTVRGILEAYGRLGDGPLEVSDEDDLYDAGMTSHASVDVMLALEGRFDLEFPEEMLRREVFRTVSSISNAIQELSKSE